MMSPDPFQTQDNKRFFKGARLKAFFQGTDQRVLAERFEMTKPPTTHTQTGSAGGKREGREER